MEGTEKDWMLRWLILAWTSFDISTAGGRYM
jgi:hypothetical protein